MCGITGIYNYKSHQSPEKQIIEAMNKTLEHRGPDDEGVFFDDSIALGHKRLSIIDLTSAGHQPIANEDETIWLTFNGEIYNYLELIPELKAQGHIFKSKSDTEVIIHAYEEYGINCLEKFNGMFAFAIWDKNKQRLFMARDRLGVKPLYYSFNDEGIVFASEIKAILQHPKHQKNNVDINSLYNFMLEGFVAGKKTLFKDINKLLQGHFLIIENEEVKISPYWKLNGNQNNDLKENEIIEKFKETFEDAIKIRLRSDVPLGFHLSGGLDSSSIVCYINKISDITPITFSGRFKENNFYDEGPFIEKVVKHVKTNHNEIFPTIGDDFKDELEKSVWFMDEPTVGSSVLAQYKVSKLVKEQGITVVLGGQGADEILGGYRRYLLPYLKDIKLVHLPCFINKDFLINSYHHLMYSLDNIGNTVKRNFNSVNNRETKDLFSLDVINTIDEEESNYVTYKKIYENNINSNSVLAKKMHYEIINYLPGLLHVEDRTSMSVSLEARTPFVDYRLVELCSEIPSYLRMKNLSSKYILRQSMKNILPEAIRTRRDKKGFPTPIDVWFRTKQKDYLREVLINGELQKNGIFNKASLLSLYENHLKGFDNSTKLWYALNAEIWYRIFIENSNKWSNIQCKSISYI